MKFLHDKRRAGAVAVLGTLVGAAALVFGITAAQADGLCGENGDVGDTTLGVGGVAYVGVNQENVGNPGGYGFWACAVPPGQGAGVGIRDASGSTPGYQVESSTCGSLTCNYIADDTGAEVATPATTTTTTGATPGASTATGSGTCVYVNGTTHPALCPGGANVAGVNVATGDASVTPKTTSGACVTALGNPCYTTALAGAGVVVAKGDTSNDTVSTTVAGTPVNRDLGDCYGYNMGTCP